MSISVSDVRTYLNEIPVSQVADSTITQEIERASNYVNNKLSITDSYWKDQVILAIAGYNVASIALLYDRVRVGDLGYSFDVSEYLERLRRRALEIMKIAGVKRAKIETTPMFDDRPKDPLYSDVAWLNDYESRDRNATW